MCTKDGAQKIVFTSGRMTCLTSRSWKGYKGLDLSVIGLYPTVVENKSSWMLVWVSGFVTLSHMSQMSLNRSLFTNFPTSAVTAFNCLSIPALRDSRSITNRLIMNLLWSSERRAVGGVWRVPNDLVDNHEALSNRIEGKRCVLSHKMHPVAQIAKKG